MKVGHITQSLNRSNAFPVPMSDDIRMTPVFLAPADRKVTVFGGGKIALRKCRHFEGFRIHVVAEDILPEIEELAEQITVTNITESNAGDFMEGADIILASTSSKQLNWKIRDIAKEKGIPVNSAHGGGNLLIPSTLRRRGFTVTVSSEGRAPAFPPYIIDKIDEFLDGSYESMLDLLVELRAEIMENIPTQPERAEALAKVIDSQEIWEMLRSGDNAEAVRKAREEAGLE